MSEHKISAGSWSYWLSPISAQPSDVERGGSGLVSRSHCQHNVTAQTGLSAKLYCCLGIENKDLGVTKYQIFIFSDQDFFGAKTLLKTFPLLFTNWFLNIDKVLADLVGEEGGRGHRNPESQLHPLHH